jgi:isopentenyldiphosphate isomerase
VQLTDDQQELFQVVDVHDRPVGARTRAECHADPTLIHRSVWVLVDTPHGMLYQRRGHGKDSSPGAWDLACAGHVAAGEEYLAAARRELAEEVGITDALPELVGTFLMRLPHETEMCAIFRLHHGGPVVVRPPEVIGLVAFRAGEEPRPLTPSAELVLAFLASQS